MSFIANKNVYSQYKRYRDPNLTFRMAMAAYIGLQKLGMIIQTASGWYDRFKMEGKLTRYRATQSLYRAQHWSIIGPYRAHTVDPII